MQRRRQDHGHRFARRGHEPELGTHLLQVVGELRGAPRRARRVHPQQLTGPDLFRYEPVGPADAEPQTAAGGDGEHGVDEAAVDPQKQLRVVEAMLPAGAGVGERGLRVGGPHVAGGSLHPSQRTEGRQRDEVRRAQQPRPGVLPVAAVDVETLGHHRVQGLQQQRTQATDRHERVTVDPPRGAPGAEEAVLGGIVGIDRGLHVAPSASLPWWLCSPTIGRRTGERLTGCMMAGWLGPSRSRTRRVGWRRPPRSPRSVRRWRSGGGGCSWSISTPSPA